MYCLRVIRLLRRCAALALLPPVLAVVGCTDRGEPGVPEVPEPGPTGTETPSDTASPDSTSEESAEAVPFECGDLFTAGRLVQILQTSLEGETERIYNDDYLESSGRTGRLTCRYGVGSGDETASPDPDEQLPAVEVAVSSYVDEETAAGRIDTTLGATSRDVAPQSIGGQEGYLLDGEDDITFVTAEGVRTYVITLRHGLVGEAAEVVVLLELAGELLDVPAPTPTPES